LDDHPTPAELEAFMRGDLPARQARAVVLHLLGGCGRCREVLAPQAETLFMWEAGLQAPPPEVDAGYDAAFDRALAAVRRMRAEPATGGARPESGGTGEAGETAETPEIAACEELIERGRAMRHDDPGEMVRRARLATAAAGALAPKVHGPRRVADLRARAWGELANAYRVANDLREADAALALAFEFCGAGSGDDLLAARLFDLQASLFGDERRFVEAQSLLDAVHAIYLRHGDRHGAGRALISKGTLTGHANDAEGAIRLLREGSSMIDAARDPQLALSALHNTAAFLAECGRFEEARALLRENRRRYREAGGRLDRLKLLGLGGIIDAGLGNLERAERELAAAKRGFDLLGLDYRSALAALDLAGVLLRRGKAAVAWEVAEEAARLFSSLGVGREALGALVLIRRAFDMGSAAAFLAKLAAFMRRAELDPEARFDPAIG
jgi:tetratricopeptide (TPR) repeat protein